MPNNFYSHGKLLITGEYVVLDGAISLAVPSKFGQSLTVFPLNESKLLWQSFDHNKSIWLECEFDINRLEKVLPKKNDALTIRLCQILNEAKTLNSDFLSSSNGFKVNTHLDFNREWGLGTSSTLINNIADWAKIDPYRLLNNTFGGSGYDIACANSDTAITYQLHNENSRTVNKVDFNPNFKEHLYFVYLNIKKNSRDAIAQYKANRPISKETISEISAITNSCIGTNSIHEFTTLMAKHEYIISNIINQHTIKEELFSDFDGQIKSLGGWGGDFVMAISEKNPIDYFRRKGFNTILPYKEMVL